MAQGVENNFNSNFDPTFLFDFYTNLASFRHSLLVSQIARRLAIAKVFRLKCKRSLSPRKMDITVVECVVLVIAACGNSKPAAAWFLLIENHALSWCITMRSRDTLSLRQRSPTVRCTLFLYEHTRNFITRLQPN